MYVWRHEYVIFFGSSAAVFVFAEIPAQIPFFVMDAVVEIACRCDFPAVRLSALREGNALTRFKKTPERPRVREDGILMLN